MTTTTTTTATASPSLVRRNPVGVFAVTAIALTWAVQFSFLAAGADDLTPALLIELVILLGVATAVTALTGGRAGVRRLFAGAVRWRIGFARFAVLVLAMPVLTLGVAAATGTLRDPAGGWPAMLGAFLFQALIFGALLGNLWEETAWAGFAQSRLTERHGLVGGALRTAVPFFLIHVPLAIGSTVGETLLGLALLALAAPFFRYLAGAVLLDTRGSVLAVAVLHGSFNAAGSLAAVHGSWQYVPAMLLLAALVAGARRR